MRLRATCQPVSFARFHSHCADKFPAPPALRAAPRAFYPCAPHICLLFLFCILSYAPKTISLFVCAVKAYCKNIFFFCCFSYLHPPFSPPFLAVVSSSSQPHAPLPYCPLLPQGIPTPPVANIVRYMTPLLSAIYPTFPILQ